MNNTFYPTPFNLIKKMWSKIEKPRNIDTILEPSAGKGDILDYIKNKGNRYKLSCIESDENLQLILTGKKYKLIDSDFLGYSGMDKFDLIIGNPPFDDGDKHLLKAIDILYSGEIVFLLNAETLKNPYTNTRKELVKRLEELGADIEYIQGSFKDAERRTGVEIALVHIKIEREYGEDLFRDSEDRASDRIINIEEKNEIASSNNIEFLVEDFNATVNAGLDVIKNYFQNQRVVKFLSLNINNEDSYYVGNSFNQVVNSKINSFLEVVRKDYWKRVLDLKDVKSRMTEKKLVEFHEAIEKQSDMDFTESNIRAFILRLIGSYEDILTEAVADIFEKMTQKHHWFDETSKNIHYFNGWKTNDAFFVNKKVILPMSGGYSDGFFEWGRWKVGYNTKRKLNDIDIVMNYFCPEKNYLSISEALDQAFERGETRNVESTYFKIAVYKKGTIHLTFRDENIRRRFNICACKHKNWLPEDYGYREYREMNLEEQEVVKSFEGVESYQKHFKQVGFINKEVLMLE